MNEQDVIDLINQIVVENHNREITGSELNAVLLAMVQQPNEAIGDVVSDINWILTQLNSGAVIHSGFADPNVTPPSSFAVGDLYSRLDVMSNPMQLYIYTGVEWVLLAENVQEAIDEVAEDATEQNKINSIKSNGVVLPFGTPPIISASTTDPDEAGIREVGNIVFDENTNQYI